MSFLTSLKPASLAVALSLSALVAGPAAAEFAYDAAAVAEARALLPQKYRDAGQITVQATVLYAPHSFYKPCTTEWSGYEIEIFNAAARILDVTPVYVEAPFQQLIAGINSGRADVSFGNLGENSLRREQVDFINHTNLTFVLQLPEADKDKITNLYDLCGLHIGLVQGSAKVEEKALQPCAELGREPAQFTEFPDTPTKEQAIRSGRLQQVEILSAALASHRKSAGLAEGAVFVDAPEVGNIYMGFIVDKGNDGLAKALEAALKLVWASGEYEQILSTYDIGFMALEEPGVNIGDRASNWLQVPAK